jgi:hypothetical protein
MKSELESGFARVTWVRGEEGFADVGGVVAVVVHQEQVEREHAVLVLHPCACRRKGFRVCIYGSGCARMVYIYIIYIYVCVCVHPAPAAVRPAGLPPPNGNMPSLFRTRAP